MGSSKSPIRVVFGLTGLKAGGKDTFADYMRDNHGFRVLRVSDAVRAEAREQDGLDDPTTDQLQDVGNRGRERGGDGYWAKRLLKMAEEEGVGMLVVNGIRHPEEFDELLRYASAHSHTEFYGVAVTAPTWARYKRLTSRGKVDDDYIVSPEDFLKMDDRDRGVGEPAGGQQVDACVGWVRFAGFGVRFRVHAAGGGCFVCHNNGTLEQFTDWIKDTVVTNLKIKV